jgi:hypothetical protein
LLGLIDSQRAWLLKVDLVRGREGDGSSRDFGNRGRGTMQGKQSTVLMRMRDVPLPGFKKRGVIRARLKLRMQENLILDSYSTLCNCWRIEKPINSPMAS